MPWREGERDGGGQERAADRDQPARARIRAAQARRREHGGARDEREAEEPAGLAAHAAVEQAQPAGLAAEHPASRPAAHGVPARPAGLAGEPAEAVVAEDQRPDRVVGRAGDPGPVRRGRECDDHGPESARDDHRGAAGEQLPDRAQAPARRHPQVRGDDPRHDHQRDGHLRLEAEPDQRAGEEQPAGAAVLERAHQRPEGADAAEDQQRVGVVVARDRDGDRRQREHEPGDEAGAAAEAAAHEVVGQRDRPDPHQRLRHEERERVEAEHAHGQRLHPQRHRRLVDGHHAGAVERPEQEGIPALAHRADGRGVVLVRPAVDVERPQVQHRGEQRAVRRARGAAAGGSGVSGGRAGTRRRRRSSCGQRRRRRSEPPRALLGIS